MISVFFRMEVFQEDGQCVGMCPDLNVSSFGDTPEEARASLQEAVEAFLEGCESLGTLEDVLAESGFRKEGAVWRPRERVSEEKAVILS